MNEEKNIDLGKEVLDEVTGGGGTKKGYDTVYCPYCGASKEVRIKSTVITCSVCGKQFEI